MILDDQFVGSDANMERVLFAPPMALDLPLLLRTKVGQDLEAWAPSFEFHFPIHNNCGGHDNKMRTPDSLITSERGQHGYSLNGLTETHFIGQNSVKFLVVQRYHPVETDNLIFSERASQKKRNLGAYLRLIQSVTRRLENILVKILWGGHLALLIFLTLLRLFIHMVHRNWILRIINFNLLLAIVDVQNLVVLLIFLVGLSYLILTLFYELLRVQGLGNLDTQFQMLLHKVLKLFGPHLLSFLLIFDVIVVLDDLLT